MFRRFQRRTGILILLAVVVLPACSGSDSQHADSNSDATTSLGTPTPPSGVDPELFAEAVGVVEPMAATLDNAIPASFVESEHILGKCVTHFGFEIVQPELAEQTGIYVYRVGEQRARYEAVYEACRVAIQELDITMLPSPETNEVLFSAYLEVYRCLQSAGFPTEPPPSKDRFLQDPESWDPWQAMIGRGHTILPDPRTMESAEFREYFDSLEACPRP